MVVGSLLEQRSRWVMYVWFWELPGPGLVDVYIYRDVTDSR